MEDRLRRRGLLQLPESLVDFYDAHLPRQVSSAATLEHFNRHLAPAERAALTLGAADIYLTAPDPAALADYPETARLADVAVAVDYAFAPGEVRDGATLRIPLLALPQLTETAVLEAVPGLAAPRIEALLRSLPKDVRRHLIPIPETARAFLRERGGSAGLAQLVAWLRDVRGLRAADATPDIGAVPRHLLPQLSVENEVGEVAHGSDLAALRRQCAFEARSALQRLAAEIFPQGPWRRFELEVLPERIAVPIRHGRIELYPTLRFKSPHLLPHLEWSAEEAAIGWRDSAPRLARLLLAAQARDLARTLDAERSLLLARQPILRQRGAARPVAANDFPLCLFRRRSRRRGTRRPSPWRWNRAGLCCTRHL